MGESLVRLIQLLQAGGLARAVPMRRTGAERAGGCLRKAAGKGRVFRPAEVRVRGAGNGQAGDYAFAGRREFCRAGRC